MKGQPLSERNGRGKRVMMNHMLVLKASTQKWHNHFTISLARANDMAKPDVHMVKYKPSTESLEIVMQSTTVSVL